MPVDEDTTPVSLGGRVMQAVTEQAPSMPPWYILLALMVGAPLTGFGGSLVGASEVAADLEDLEEKVDQLARVQDALNRAQEDLAKAQRAQTEAMVELRIAIVRYHANDPQD